MLVLNEVHRVTTVIAHSCLQERNLDPCDTGRSVADLIVDPDLKGAADGVNFTILDKDWYA